MYIYNIYIIIINNNDIGYTHHIQLHTCTSKFVHIQC